MAQEPTATLPELLSYGTEIKASPAQTAEAIRAWEVASLQWAREAHSPEDYWTGAQRLRAAAAQARQQLGLEAVTARTVELFPDAAERVNFLNVLQSSGHDPEAMDAPPAWIERAREIDTILQREEFRGPPAGGKGGDVIAAGANRLGSVQVRPAEAGFEALVEGAQGKTYLKDLPPVEQMRAEAAEELRKAGARYDRASEYWNRRGSDVPPETEADFEGAREWAAYMERAAPAAAARAYAERGLAKDEKFTEQIPQSWLSQFTARPLLQMVRSFAQAADVVVPGENVDPEAVESVAPGALRNRVEAGQGGALADVMTSGVESAATLFTPGVLAKAGMGLLGRAAPAARVAAEMNAVRSAATAPAWGALATSTFGQSYADAEQQAQAAAAAGDAEKAARIRRWALVTSAARTGAALLSERIFPEERLLTGAGRAGSGVLKQALQAPLQEGVESSAEALLSAPVQWAGGLETQNHVEAGLQGVVGGVPFGVLNAGAAARQSWLARQPQPGQGGADVPQSDGQGIRAGAGAAGGDAQPVMAGLVAAGVAAPQAGLSASDVPSGPAEAGAPLAADALPVGTPVRRGLGAIAQDAGRTETGTISGTEAAESAGTEAVAADTGADTGLDTGAGPIPEPVIGDPAAERISVAQPEPVLDLEELDSGLGDAGTPEGDVVTDFGLQQKPQTRSAEPVTTEADSRSIPVSSRPAAGSEPGAADPGAGSPPDVTAGAGSDPATLAPGAMPAAGRRYRVRRGRESAAAARGQSFGSLPLVRFIQEQGGIVSMRQALLHTRRTVAPEQQAAVEGQIRALYNDVPAELSSPEMSQFQRMLFNRDARAGVRLDQMAQAAFEAGLIPDSNPSTLGQALGETLNGYLKSRERRESGTATQEAYETAAGRMAEARDRGIPAEEMPAQEKKDRKFLKDTEKAKKGLRRLDLEELTPGSTVRVKGEKFRVEKIETDEDGYLSRVLLKDGPQYGVQWVYPDTVHFVESVRVARTPKAKAAAEADLPFSRGTPASVRNAGRGVTETQARSAVDILRRVAPEVVAKVRFLRNASELDLTKYHPDDGEVLSDPDTEGFYDPATGGTTVFLDQLAPRDGETRVQAVARVLLHERVGHAGLAVLRSQDRTFARQWQQLADAIPPEELAALLPRYPHLAEDPDRLAEEWFAERAGQLTPEQLAREAKRGTLLGRMWQALRDVVARIWQGFSASARTAAELDRRTLALLQASRRALADTAQGPLAVAEGEVQSYFDFHGVPEEKRQKQAAAAQRLVEMQARPAPALRQKPGAEARRAEANRAYAALVNGDLTAKDAALRALEQGPVSALMHGVLSREIPGFDVRGAVVESAEDVAALMEALRNPYVESLKVLVLDSRQRVIGSRIVSVGSLDMAVAEPREILAAVVDSLAGHKGKVSGWMISHNHPSGDPSPSDADNRLTRRMHDVANQIGIPLLDHVVTNGRKYWSYRQNGMLNPGKRHHPQVGSSSTAPRPDWQPAWKPKLAEWEVLPAEERLSVITPETLKRLAQNAAAVDPGHAHLIYLDTRMQVMTVERLPMEDAGPQLVNGLAREPAKGVLLLLPPADEGPDFLSQRERTAIRNLRETSELLGIRFYDGARAGMTNSLREMGLLYSRTLRDVLPVQLPAWLQARMGNGVASPAFRVAVKAQGARTMLTGSALPREFAEIVRRGDLERQAVESAAAQLGGDLLKAMESWQKRSTQSAADVADLVAQAMEDPAVLAAMADPVLRERTRRARNFLDQLSDEIAAITGGQLGRDITANRGHWMRRIYAAFDAAAGWNYDALTAAAAKGQDIAGRPARQILDKARAYLQRTHPQLTPGGLEAMMRQLMDRTVWEGHAAGTNGPRVTKEVSSFIARQNIPPEIRALMGEEKNPVRRLQESVKFQAQLVARHAQQEAMRDLGLRTGLFSETQEGVYTEPVGGESAGSNQRWNGLAREVDGKRVPIYTTPELLQAMQTSMGTSTADIGHRIVDAIRFIGGEAKLNKVALSPDSWAVNIMGNVVGLVATGDLTSYRGWRNVARAFSLLRAGKMKPGDALNAAAEAVQDQQRALLARLAAGGVTSAGVTLQDLQASLDTRLLQFIEGADTVDRAAGVARGAVLGQAFGGAFGPVGQGIGAAVGAVGGGIVGGKRIRQAQAQIAEWVMGGPDRLAKVSAYMTDYEAHRAAGMAEAQAHDLAVQKTLDTLPNYAAVPAWMRELSRIGVLQSFLSFQYEVYRNTFHNVRYALQELRTPGLQARGVQRLTGVSAVLGAAAYGLPWLLQGAAGGADEEKDRAYRRALAAPWERDSVLAYTRLDAEGASFFNTSYLLPQVTMLELVQAAREGRTFQEGLEQAAGVVHRQFAAGSVFLDPLLAAFWNTKAGGMGPVTNRQGAAGAKDRMQYVLDMIFEPGAAGKLDRVLRSKEIWNKPRGNRQYSLEEEWKRLLGIRQGTYQHEDRIEGRLWQMRARYEAARGLARDAWRENAPGNGREAGLAEANADVARLNAEAQQWLTDLRTLGIPDNKVRELEKRTGVQPSRGFMPFEIRAGEDGQQGPRAQRRE